MYQPEYQYTDKFVQTLVKLENLRTTLESLDVSYNTKQKLQQRSKTLDIFHFAHMLKVDITLKDAEKILNGRRVEYIDEIRSTIIRNYKNVLEFTRSAVSDNYSEIDKSIIMHINRLMLSQWKETWEANIRSFNDKIDDRWDNYIDLRDTDIPIAEIDSELNDLIEWYKYSVPTTPAVVRIAVFFYRLIRIAPFNAGNKFVALAILDWLMIKNGLGAKSQISIARVFQSNDEKILRSLEIINKAKDISYWAETLCQLILSEMIQTKEEIGEFIQQEEKSKQQPFLNLNKRQLKVLKYLQTVPEIKREDYCHMMDVSTMTAFRDLSDLVRKKLLKVDGQGRGTKYRLITA